MQAKPAKTSAPPPVRHPSPETCAHCLSSLVHLESWRELPNGAMTLRVRCPECEARSEGDYDANQVAVFDDAMIRARVEIRALHAAVVRENLEREAELFTRAFELDLIGPGDFELRRH